MGEEEGEVWGTGVGGDWGVGRVVVGLGSEMWTDWLGGRGEEAWRGKGIGWKEWGGVAA